MPRIARNIISFNLGSRQMTATFTHQHAPDFPQKGWEGILYDAKYGPKLLRHITTCTITSENGIAVGVSRCSMSEAYRWKHGIKQSLSRAAEEMGIKKGTPDYSEFMRSFYEESGVKRYRMDARIPARVIGYIPTHRPTGAVPTENLHGLGHTGMD